MIQRRYLHLFLIFVCFFSEAQAQTKLTNVPAPKSVLGFEPTDNKTIADYGQITNYFSRLDAASERVKVKTIGQTTLGKPFIAAFISSAENLRNLDKYQEINRQLADPRSVRNESERERLITQGKTIVVISCSIHSTEIVASQMSMNLAYELATASDAETQEILDNTILLLIPSANPDGVNIVADWYRKTLNTASEGTAPPELYHFYAGHDNNRDWFMLNLKETQVLTNLFWQNWFPEIVYDVHQMGQTGARFIIPPFFDPPNPNISPLILRETGLLGYKIAADLQADNLNGVATNAYFDTWWHGGFRSAPYYHNSIGILSEAASANLMSPVNITKVQLEKSPKQRGLESPLQTGTNQPAAWIGGIWTPRDIAQMESSACRSILLMAAKFRSNYLKNFYDLNLRASRGEAVPGQPAAYVIYAGQPTGENVSRLIEILIAQGIEVHRLTREIKATIVDSNNDHTEIPLNSFVIFTAQPQRANVQALFERQVYPNRINAGGEAEVPYDVAGWTLPLQMGVETAALTQIDGYPEKIDDRLEKITNVNQARRVLNLDAQKEAFAKIANPLPKQTKIGVYKSYAASIDEGWTRFVFDEFQIPFQSLIDRDVRKTNLNTRLDAIILPAQSEKEIIEGLSAEKYPSEFSGGIGEAGIQNLRKFVEAGGTLICFADSCELLINHFKLPLKNVLENLKRNEFYCPGSILALDVDTSQELAKGLRKQTAAYFINSAAFEITNQNEADRIKIVARYAEKNALLSGWLLGEKYLNGKIAVAEASLGAGKIILFGFRPQHRGQTWATFPFIFNSLTNKG